MNPPEAREILKIALAHYAGKYPKIISRCSKFISQHPDKDKALSIVVKNLMELDQYAEWLFREELDIDNTINWEPNNG